MPVNIPALLQQIVASPENPCFVCGEGNPHGLRVHFTQGKVGVLAQFTTEHWQQGWQGVIHGGILAALLDEAMAYALFFEGHAAVTARMELRYRQPIRAGEAITVGAHIVRQTRKVADIEGDIRRCGEVVVEASGRFIKLGSITADMAAPLRVAAQG